MVGIEDLNEKELKAVTGIMKLLIRVYVQEEVRKEAKKQGYDIINDRFVKCEEEK